MGRSATEVTAFLTALVGGDEGARAELLPLIYDELHDLAAERMRGERKDHTLQATALVNEAWLRLVQHDRIDWQGKTHFFALAATTLRRVLVDHARTRNARKRGGGTSRVTLEDPAADLETSRLDVLALDEAMEKLSTANSRQARVVELRFLAGLSVEETAFALGVGPDTVKSDWRFARAWLNRELSRGQA